MARAARSGIYQYEWIEWVQLKQRYKNRCVRCSRKEDAEHPLQPDHVIPIDAGGSKNIWNIQPLCDACNKWKANKIAGKKGEVLDWRDRKFKN